MGMILVLIGGLVALVGAVIVLIAAFKESIVWGLVSLLVPFAVLVFIATHWAVSKNGFFIWLGGFVLMVIGNLIGGPSMSVSATY